MVKGREKVNRLRQNTLALAWASAFTNQGLPLIYSINLVAEISKYISRGINEIRYDHEPTRQGLVIELGFEGSEYRKLIYLD